MPHCKLQVPAQELHDFDLRAPGFVVGAPSHRQWRPAVTRRFDPRTLAAARALEDLELQLKLAKTNLEVAKKLTNAEEGNVATSAPPATTPGPDAKA